MSHSVENPLKIAGKIAVPGAGILSADPPLESALLVHMMNAVHSALMKILLLLGGTNDPSNAECLADRFTEGMKKEVPGLTVEKIRLREVPIDHFSLKHYDPTTDQGEVMRKIEAVTKEAAGIVIATPIWNFSVPAHLKNVIDRMGSFALDAETRTKGQIKGKPCYFLFTGGAPVPAWKGLMRFTTMHVPEAFRYFGGSIIGRYFEGKCMRGRGKFGCVIDKRPDSLMKVEARGRKFARIASRFHANGEIPLSCRIITRLYLWGQRIIAKF